MFQLEKVRKYKTLHCKEGFVSVTLEDCFNYYQEKGLLCGKNHINLKCRMCNHMMPTKYLLFTSPEVMTIILNRGKG